jgi:hypothetical protein
MRVLALRALLLCCGATLSRCSSFCQDFAKAPGHDSVLTGLEHPNTHDDRVFIRRKPAGTVPTRSRVEFNTRIAPT